MGSAPTNQTYDDFYESSHSLLVAYLKTHLAEMHPAYFALVMATGIVSIACKFFGLSEIAGALSRINLVVYPLLWILYTTRAIMFWRQFLADWSDHARAPGFFTVAAATGVLGSQEVILHESVVVAQFLWWASVVLWIVCTYTIFASLTIRKEKPLLAQGINGGWLVAVVATQSVCVLGCLLNGTILPDHRDAVLFVLMSLWLGGGMLYIWIIGLIFYRYMFFSFSPNDLMPPYWINMGAVAISTVAGTLLAHAAESSPTLLPLRPFILGLSIMFWATATWWIPMLLILGAWRYYQHKIQFTYDPLYWGLVFPLGMYSVCSFRLANVLNVAFLMWIARLFFMAALSAWLLTFLGLTARALYAVLLGCRGKQARNISKNANTQMNKFNHKGGITS